MTNQSDPKYSSHINQKNIGHVVQQEIYTEIVIVC